MPAYITITARLARDPELRETPHGKSLCKLSLPNDSGWGENKLTTWWGCTIWGKRGETAAQYLKKGSWVTVTGVPSLRKYEKRDGSEGTSLEVEVNDWGFCGPKPAPAGKGSAGGYKRNDYSKDAPSPDIPF
jgi:single-strand DNA-binding protein